MFSLITISMGGFGSLESNRRNFCVAISCSSTFSLYKAWMTAGCMSDRLSADVVSSWVGRKAW
uniref:Uncharacterized protein n=1 Tax=Anopheles minimus TaxID=112268 RepID=A0A182WPJ0_9DIPT